MTSVPAAGGSWQALFPLDSIPARGAREFELAGWRGFALHLHGQWAVYLNSCPHRNLPLNWQANRFLSADARHLICANHGALFDPLLGDCLAGPCVGQALKHWPHRVRGGMLEVAQPPF